MKKLNVEDAVGMTLCHDVTAMIDGFKGPAFKRGHVIEKEDIPKLLDYGKKHIFVWEEHVGEIHEEDASIRLSKMNDFSNAHYEGPSEGKILLIADEDGMWTVDVDLLHEINMIGDITIATLPNHYKVEKGMRLASMRIVPLVTKEEQIIKAESLCKNRRLYNLHPFTKKRVGIIITGSEIYSGRIKDRFEPVCRNKLSKYPSEIVDVKICDDDIEMLNNSAKELINKGVDIIIFSGGMSVDPDDITKTVIKDLGTDIISHGVPSQPGNMALVGYLNDITILGVPGAAVSLPTTIFDVLLPQVFSGIKFTKKDLVNLSNGGLCQLCKTCHFPNCTFGRY